MAAKAYQRHDGQWVIYDIDRDVYRPATPAEIAAAQANPR